MRCIVALFFGTALLGASDPQFTAAAFYWDAIDIAIVAGNAPAQLPEQTTKIAHRNARPPWGEMFALPEVSGRNGIKIGDAFDVNLTGNYWVRARATSFIYNKNEYQNWIFAIATIDPEHQERYTAAIREKLHVFLVEPSRPQRVSDTGPIRRPSVKVDLSPSERALLEANLNEIMMAKLHRAMLKEQTTSPADLLSQLLGGKAKLTVDVDQVDLGQPVGVRQHVLGTWIVGHEPVFSVQGWKRPATDLLESLEAIDGLAEDKAEMIGAIGDWGEASLDDFTIENVFPGGRLIRHSAGYESSNIYLERMTGKGRAFKRSLYGT